jgi:multiple sugar transport system permease protein
MKSNQVQTTGKSPMRPLLWFLVPIGLYMLVFYLYPMLYDLYISLFDYTLGQEREFIGLENYGEMLKDEQYLNSLVVTFLFVVSAVSIQLILGFLIALLLNQESRLMNIIRTIILIPTVFTPLVAGLVWKALYHPDLGLLTYYLRELGINIGRGLTVERGTALLAVIIVDIWEWTPLMVIIILAGLKSLPTEPFEAAIVDGASRINIFFYITLPLLQPSIIVALLIRTLDVLKVFDIIFAMTRGGPGTATTVANLRIYEVGMEHLRVGYAASLSNILLLIGLVIGVLFIRKMYTGGGTT